MDLPITNLPDKHLFYVIIDGKKSFMQYRILDETTWEYVHTFVPGALRGKGIATSIVKFALDYAREHQLKVKPSCPTVRAYVDKHHEYDDLLVEVD